MSTTPETLEQQAAAVQERRDALAANLDAVEAKLEAERDALGSTVAQGGKTGKHRERLRELEEEAEGLRRALPILDREADAPRQRVHDLRLTSARGGYEQSASRARNAVMQVDMELRSFPLRRTRDTPARHACGTRSRTHSGERIPGDCSPIRTTRPDPIGAWRMGWTPGATHTAQDSRSVREHRRTARR